MERPRINFSYWPRHEEGMEVRDGGGKGGLGDTGLGTMVVGERTLGGT